MATCIVPDQTGAVVVTFWASRPPHEIWVERYPVLAWRMEYEDEDAAGETDVEPIISEVLGEVWCVEERCQGETRWRFYGDRSFETLDEALSYGRSQVAAVADAAAMRAARVAVRES